MQTAPSPIQAAEMVLVRLAYVADLPAPADLVRLLQDGAAGADRAGASPPARAAPIARRLRRARSPAARCRLGPIRASRRQPAEITSPAPPVAVATEPMPQSFAEVLALFDERREAVMRSHLVSHLHLVHFEPGRIEFRPAEGAPRDLANRLGAAAWRMDRDALARRDL